MKMTNQRFRKGFRKYIKGRNAEWSNRHRQIYQTMIRKLFLNLSKERAFAIFEESTCVKCVFKHTHFIFEFILKFQDNFYVDATYTIVGYTEYDVLIQAMVKTVLRLKDALAVLPVKNKESILSCLGISATEPIEQVLQVLNSANVITLCRCTDCMVIHGFVEYHDTIERPILSFKLLTQSFDKIPQLEVNAGQITRLRDEPQKAFEESQKLFEYLKLLFTRIARKFPSMLLQILNETTKLVEEECTSCREKKMRNRSNSFDFLNSF